MSMSAPCVRLMRRSRSGPTARSSARSRPCARTPPPSPTRPTTSRRAIRSCSRYEMKITPVIPSRADQIRAEAKRSRGTSSFFDEISLLRASRSGRDDGVRRRALLKAAALLPLLLPFGARVVSAAPAPEAVTPALVEAAKKEGKVSYYTAMDLSVAEPMAKAFEAKYPGIKVAVERTGAERLFNRIAQEEASNIRRADVVNSSDAAHFMTWKRQGWLQPYLTVEMAENVPAAERDPDGTFTNQRTHLSAIAYNTSLIKPEDAPKGFIDLLDPKYTGKLVKGHPG